MTFEVARHLGVSFVEGQDLTHVWVAADAVPTLQERWQRRLVGTRLAQPLSRGPAAGHFYAPTFALLGESHLRDALSLPDTEQGDAEAAALLVPAAFDRRTYDGSYGLYREVAHARGWVATPSLLGRYASCLVGVGKHARLVSLNVGQHIGSPITFAGTHKGYGREFLRTHGLPVAPGGHAATAEGALRRAREVGWPVVLKGLQSGNSEAVILGLRDPEGCLEAAASLLEASGPPVLVEAMVEGTEVRAHFVAGTLHSLYRAQARHVEGDGKRSILKLMHDAMPEMLRTTLAHPTLARRLVYQLWRFGVRRVEDLPRLIVGEGERIRVSPATASGMEELELDAIHADDHARLEALLRRYGSPSAGVDLMLPALGKPLSEGGIVIELNCPCGFGYVSDPRAVAGLEIDALVATAPGFVAAAGRVPVWLLTAESFADAERRRRTLDAAARMGAVGVHRANPEHGWQPILADDKDLLIVELDEARVRRMGMPAHLQPQLLTDAPQALCRSHPLLWATVAHAGGGAQAFPTAE